MKYNYYKTDGTKEVIEVEQKLTLRELQTLVGGYIEMLDLADGTTLVLNEEGLLQNLERNPFFRGQYLAGNIVQGRATRYGNFVGLKEEKK